MRATEWVPRFENARILRKRTPRVQRAVRGTYKAFRRGNAEINDRGVRRSGGKARGREWQAGSLGVLPSIPDRGQVDDREDAAMRIEVREANASSPERPLWVWTVYWGNRIIGRGFCPSEKEASEQAKLAAPQASRSR